MSEKLQTPKLAPYDYAVKLFLPIIPESVKPNHLTFLRLILTPVLIILLVIDQFMVGLVFFICLALTDIFDGSIARLRNQITDWGKVWDPIADKLLIGSVVAVLLLEINLSLAILLFAFEAAFILGGTFQKMKRKDVELQANIWGKIKMNFHAFGAGFLILGFFLASANLITTAEVLLYISLLFASMSLVTKGI